MLLCICGHSRFGKFEPKLYQIYLIDVMWLKHYLIFYISLQRINDKKDSSADDTKSLNEKGSAQSSNLVFGYLNLFSDGVVSKIDICFYF